ncbi:hypothetical protein EB73_36005 [Mycobacterium sp. SWH-M3]|nr:hypothetical protein EB73_36005 [Mycobacterium sp. SWH-M3]
MQRLEVLFEEMAELCGQRNAIDGRLVQIVAEIDRDELWGATGARSMTALVAWKTGITPHNADTMLAVARRVEEFPQCTRALSEGRLSLDQVGVIAARAADGSDAHYATNHNHHHSTNDARRPGFCTNRRSRISAPSTLYIRR